MATKTNLPKWVRGDTRRIRVTVNENGVNQLAAGDLLHFTLKNENTDADVDAVVQKTYVVTAGDVTAEEAYITIDSTDTDSLDVKTYHYDVQWVRVAPDPDEVHTLSYGTVAFITDITRTIS